MGQDGRAEGALSKRASSTTRYGANLPEFLQAQNTILPFYYESTGVETFFRDERDPSPRSRRVFAFHQPETLAPGWPNRTPCVPVSRLCLRRTRSGRSVRAGARPVVQKIFT